jgi:hypothetical protein
MVHSVYGTQCVWYTVWSLVPALSVQCTKYKVCNINMYSFLVYFVTGMCMCVCVCVFYYVTMCPLQEQVQQ